MAKLMPFSEGAAKAVAARNDLTLRTTIPEIGWASYTAPGSAAAASTALLGDPAVWRTDYVRPAHEDGALAGALPRQPDLAVRQVAQPAVHELRRPPAGARGEVGALQQHDGQPAARGVQRHARAGHPAAHDDDVDLGARRGRPGPRSRRAGTASRAARRSP